QRSLFGGIALVGRIEESMCRRREDYLLHRLLHRNLSNDSGRRGRDSACLDQAINVCQPEPVRSTSLPSWASDSAKSPPAIATKRDPSFPIPLRSEISSFRPRFATGRTESESPRSLWRSGRCCSKDWLPRTPGPAYAAQRSKDQIRSLDQW